MIKLESELSQIKGIDRRFLFRLHKLNIKTVKDLLRHFPSRYDDYSRFVKISDLQINQAVTIQGRVEKISLRRAWRRRMTVIEAIISDDSGSVKAIWFNQPYLARTLYAGRIANFAGKINASHDDMCLSNPTYEFPSLQGATKHTAGLIPVYPETKGLTSRGLRYLIKALIKNLNKINDFVPKEILEENGFPEITAALNKIHFPKDLKESEVAKKRFAFEDLFMLQLNNIQIRQRLAKEKAVGVGFNEKEFEEIVKIIPFELTASQKQSLSEILSDIRKPHPMNRLLQGDVGSGKTVVAAVAALLTAKQGFQSAFMAPTEVLARQHYKTLSSIFGGLISNWKLNLGILTGNEAISFFGESLETKKKKSEFINDIAGGSLKIIIGTHALIQKNVSFKNLAITIVDEQHRFGVRQRATLAGNESGFCPHFLSMSATPIPRTLSLTVFGDLDLSIINELPKGRQPIITKIVAPGNRQKAYAFIREQIKRGRQAFVICPRITAAEESLRGKNMGRGWFDVKAVEEEYKKLSGEVFPDLVVAMLHGKMKSEEKSRIMSDFSQNKTSILVSTSVVEIGVDIPNASIMVIEGADRFGLSQLYQFRGRVGRGEHQSFCLLFTDSSSATAHQRLKFLIEARNGFELAEKDLAMRGPGEFLGDSQTGLPDLAMQSLKDIELIKSSRDAAVKVLKKSPGLNNYPLLKQKLDQFKKQVHLE